MLAVPPAGASGASNPTPTLAYYYIWFNPSSWKHAKIDYPQLGRYSSDEQSVMRRHIAWAKQAGIDGFLVSWKSTPVLDARLAQLVRIAAQQHFKLEIVYEGLDFERRPLPVVKVASDLALFAHRYAHNPVFDLFGKPVVEVTGTWKFSRPALRKITRARQAGLQVLASARNLRDYERVADLFDGNGYYWSSVNPDTFPGYEAKLRAMSQAVHAHQGLWIAPAAPGFDARRIGGHTVVDRRGGDTFRRELSAAAGSSPDALGVISWNEFSENSYIEPSIKQGAGSLRVLAQFLGAKPPQVGDFDSSAPQGRHGSGALLITGGGLLAMFVALFAVRRWSRSRRPPSRRLGRRDAAPPYEHP